VAISTLRSRLPVKRERWKTVLEPQVSQRLIRFALDVAERSKIAKAQAQPTKVIG
jgi:hypothetical protein